MEDGFTGRELMQVEQVLLLQGYSSGLWEMYTIIICEMYGTLKMGSCGCQILLFKKKAAT